MLKAAESSFALIVKKGKKDPEKLIFVDDSYIKWFRLIIAVIDIWLLFFLYFGTTVY